jgi:sterol desaturase/sphingolipid hydroxylase (fatty acid hydroxylase superfamily)
MHQRSDSQPSDHEPATDESPDLRDQWARGVSQHGWATRPSGKSQVTMEKQVRLYKNPVLEWLTRAHPLVPILFWGPVTLALVYWGYRAGISAAGTIAITAGGLLTWTLCEYILHRWIFHWEPKGEGLRRFYYPMHRLHHDVQEWDRLVTPLLMAVPFWLAFFGLFYLVLGQPWLFPFAGGFTIGYLGYDYVHYMTHFGTPKSKMARTLRQRHLQHHFGGEDVWFGVSSQIWDYVFRTTSPKRRTS